MKVGRSMKGNILSILVKIPSDMRTKILRETGIWDVLLPSNKAINLYLNATLQPIRRSKLVKF